jgi:outer membrane usher protein
MSKRRAVRERSSIRGAARFRGTVLALACLAGGTCALAQPAGAPTAPQPQEESLIVTVRVNGVARGDYTLLRQPGGDFWIAAEDLQALKIEPRQEARRQRGSEVFYSAAALGAATVRFTEADLTLELTFAAQALAGTQIDLSARPARPDAAAITPSTSLIASYRLTVQPAAQGRPAEGFLEGDINVRTHGILLRQETQLAMGSQVEGRRVSRGVTQAIWDDPVRAIRVIAGDVVSTAGSYGSAITGAGLLVAKVYDLAPDIVRQPMAQIQTAANLPAEVEVSVDGTTMYRARVGPGPISLNNLLLQGGARNVRVTVTDISGRREVIEQPFLFTDSVLAKGFHEYSYFVGKRSEFKPDRSWDYLEPAWQGYHRYGLTDSVTIAAGGEGSPDFTNAGAGLTLRSDRFGLFSVDLLGSATQGAPSVAKGWSARYTYLTPSGSVVLGRRRFDDGFRTFTTSAANPFLREETRVSATTRLWDVTMTADLARTIDALGRRNTRALRMSTNIGRSTTLHAEYQTTRTGDTNGWTANFYLRHDLDATHWVSTAVRAAPGARGVDLEAGRQLPQGEGFGWRVGVSANQQEGVQSASGFVSGAYNARHATFEGFAAAPLHGGGAQYANFAVSGALVALDGYWGLTRRVNDGFALARLGVPEAGVDVLLNNQVLGKTGPEGTLFIPQVGAFGRQDVSIDDKQLSLAYTLDRKRLTIAPAYRSGTLVDFGARRVRAVVGTASFVQNGRAAPVAARAWTMRSGAGSLRVETSNSGEFYLEDAPPGRYGGTIEHAGRTYACSLEVPETTEPVQELKEGIRCE